MKMIIDYLPACRLAYIRAVGPYGSQNERVMTQLKTWAHSHGLLEAGTILGIPHDNPATTLPENCRYDAAIVIEEQFILDAEVQEGFFPEGAYAVFELAHTEESLSTAWDSLFQQLAEAGIKLGKGAIIERYRSELVSQHLCEICVPLKEDL